MTNADIAVLTGEVNHALSWGIGALALAILLGLLVALIAFGAGREHS
jgi:hypothetical protein